MGDHWFLPYINVSYPAKWTDLNSQQKTTYGAIGHFYHGSSILRGHFNLNFTKDMRLNIKESWSLKYRAFTLSTLSNFILGDSHATDACLMWGCPRGHNFFAKFNGITCKNGVNNWVFGAMFNFCDKLRVGAESNFGGDGNLNVKLIFRRIFNFIWRISSRS